MKKYDITAVGECLIDFVSRESGREDQLLMEGNPGGAPANVLACAAKLGDKTAMIGKLGADSFGYFLRGVLTRAGIDTDAMVMSTTDPTTLAFVTLSPSGDRSFSFYRKGSADVMLTPDELNYGIIGNTRIFHFGSVSMTANPSREATLAAVRYAKEHQALISYDPNLRERLWGSLDEAKQVILQGFSFADLVKLSEEELVFLTGQQDLVEGMNHLFRQYPVKLLVVTRGPKGCICKCGETVISSPAYDVNCVDTTGAGDTFWGTLLHCLLRDGISPENLTHEQLEEMLHYANAAGSLVTGKKGAIPALPTMEDIENCIKTAPYCKA